MGCAALMMGACSMEEDDIFDKSASERLDEGSGIFSQRLIDGQDGWAFEYYTQPETNPDLYQLSVGYLMLAKFRQDKSVVVGMSNAANNNVYDEAESAWQVINDMGAVLSFNTHNRVLHKFSDPEDCPLTGGEYDDETGKGMSGDYEFVIVDAPEGGDYVMLKGKKHKAYSRLTRLSAGTDFKEYIDDVRRFQGVVLPNTAPNHLVMTVGEKQYYFIMPSKGGNLGLTKLWPAGTDSTFTMVYNPLLSTRHVSASNDTTYTIRFRDPIEGSDGIVAQEFVYNPATQSMTGKDNDAISLTGEVPAIFFEEAWNSHAKFQLKTTLLGSEKGNALISALNTDYKSVKYSLQNIQLAQDEKGAAVSINFKDAKSSSGSVTFYFDCTMADGVLTLSNMKPKDDPATKQLDALASLKPLLEALSSSFEFAVGDHAMNLSTICLKSKADSNLVFKASYTK